MFFKIKESLRRYEWESVNKYSFPLYLPALKYFFLRGNLCYTFFHLNI